MGKVVGSKCGDGMHRPRHPIELRLCVVELVKSVRFRNTRLIWYVCRPRIEVDNRRSKDICLVNNDRSGAERL